MLLSGKGQPLRAVSGGAQLSRRSGLALDVVRSLLGNAAGRLSRAAVCWLDFVSAHKPFCCLRSSCRTCGRFAAKLCCVGTEHRGSCLPREQGRAKGVFWGTGEHNGAEALWLLGLARAWCPANIPALHDEHLGFCGKVTGPAAGPGFSRWLRLPPALQGDGLQAWCKDGTSKQRAPDTSRHETSRRAAPTLRRLSVKSPRPAAA